MMATSLIDIRLRRSSTTAAHFCQGVKARGRTRQGQIKLSIHPEIGSLTSLSLTTINATLDD
jgi:hypothetical protein